MKKSIVFFLSFIIASCELVVDVDVPMKTPKITVNSFFAADSVWGVQLHKSKYVLDEGDFQPIANAAITIKQDGLIYENLTHEGNGFYSSPSGNKPVPGKNYDIEITAPDMASVSAQSSIPDSAEVKNVVFTYKDGTTTGTGSFNFILDLEFQDNPNVENFYEVQLFTESFFVNRQNGDTIRFFFPMYIFTDDQSIDDLGSESILFSDKLFNGKEYKLAIKGTDFNTDSKFTLYFRTLSEDMYKYKLTSSLQNNSSGDPFAQPVHVYNNISNGFGIFAGYHSTVIKIDP